MNGNSISISTRQFKSILILSASALVVCGCCKGISPDEKPATSRSQVNASASPSLLADEILCGVLSRSELQDKLSFRAASYAYSNAPSSGTASGRFTCELRSPYGDEGHSPIIRIEFDGNASTKQAIISPDGGYIHFEVDNKKGQGDGRMRGANNLAWLYSNGMVLKFSYYDWAGYPPYLSSDQQLEFSRIFSELIDKVPEYNSHAGVFANTKVGPDS